MTDEPFHLKPIEPVTFDANLFQSLIEEQARIEALYGPRLKSVSGCVALVHWLMRQFPEADPGVTAVNLLGSVAVLVDDEVPFDSLRLAYADGTHKDVRVIDWMTGDWPAPEDTYLPPQDGLRAALQRDATPGRPLLYDPDQAMGGGAPMAMMSDWDGDGGNGYPASCARCADVLGNWPTAQQAADAEMNHMLRKHRVTLDDAGSIVPPATRGPGKKTKPTRDQKRNKFRKPGTR